MSTADMASATVTVEIVGGPSTAVAWFSGMNAQQALEAAYMAIGNNAKFTYALQYYGSALGYLVVMINETYDSFVSSSAPFFYWQFLVNGTPATQGIDNTVLQQGDTVSFQFEMYQSNEHSESLLHVKYKAQVEGHA